jgi:hypothetical protein
VLKSTGLFYWNLTGVSSYVPDMACFHVTLSPPPRSAGEDEPLIESVDHADAYQQEGPLTTFFTTRDDGGVIDSWSRRQASFRTADIVAVRRVDELAPTAPLLRTA